MSDRRLEVLRAIVEDYVATREPVGSKALVERHRLGVSSATIRNDMSALEDEGLIAQPHTSAGRVPTDLGYRTFVDRISGLKPLSQAERNAITMLLDGPMDLDDTLERTVRLLAQLTRQVAVVQYPQLSASRIRHIELVSLAADRSLVVLITDNGRVEQSVVVTEGLGENDLADLRARLNTALVNVRITDVSDMLDSLRVGLPEVELPAFEAVLRVVGDLAEANREDRIVMAGTANLARAGTDFGESIGPLLEAIEEQVVLLKLLSTMGEDSHEVTVRIGHENSHSSLAGASLVATGYASGGDVSATLGVLGPTRMDYPTTMAAVRAVARYVSRILN
ncbi:heat-inducible transcriptional repressor HrcA [Spelaeicoccus albus]|uniref:Heat-inducible transcription repressor HrcA n=1 Tax=Spelaeicoccus albus TaxID=1280376 RepID=A0A7Z0IIN2_9MICO|nr:heat-inducible transcriptional repressor HrcA [Spelaeicoccus albus]NYI68688.1 heat-inducible transcriptional repressor [Spelaeicoccus albus]